MFPRIFDPVSMKMTIKTPLLPIEYDISMITTVHFKKSKTHSRQGTIIVHRAVAETQSGKKITIFQINDTGNLISNGKTTIEQLCRQMGWQFKED
ncbi:hypothetical protein DRQ26_06735 [bacterium]|nr:MAG: hypothetical protein DRQ26_06735 [bacterium]